LLPAGKTVKSNFLGTGMIPVMAVLLSAAHPRDGDHGRQHDDGDDAEGQGNATARQADARDDEQTENDGADKNDKDSCTPVQTCA
jgi:hypothetical protein